MFMYAVRNSVTGTSLFTGFGAPGHIRFSFAVSMQTLEKALERMGKALRG